jgi:hypothetical protein
LATIAAIISAASLFRLRPSKRRANLDLKVGQHVSAVFERGDNSKRDVSGVGEFAPGPFENCARFAALI